MIELRTGTKIWIAAGVTDMRRGFDGLSAQVQTVLEQQPFSGHVFVFRGRRGDIVKLLWFDGDGLCLFHQVTGFTLHLFRFDLKVLILSFFRKPALDLRDGPSDCCAWLVWNLATRRDTRAHCGRVL